MPRICYVEKNFGSDSLSLIDIANDILDDYEAQGFDLTLRQLYYQFVTRNEIENSEKSYKKIGKLVSDARLAGLIDWNRIVDRTRDLKRPSHWSCPWSILNQVSKSYAIDKWIDQEYYVEVWVEKEALIGIIERVSRSLDLSCFACKGYVSQSEMWAAGQRFIQHMQDGRVPVILHLGDHDPSGIDMTRDIHERLYQFTHYHREQLEACPSGVTSFEVRRIALTMDQIEEYQPPPNPAKLSDSRAGDYIEKYGNESWELDALDPTTLSELIVDEVDCLIDQATYDRFQAAETEDKKRLKMIADRWEEVSEFLDSSE